VAAELPAKGAVNPYPLPHGNPPCEFNTAVARQGVGGKKFRCPGKEDRNPFTREFPGSARGFMSGHRCLSSPVLHNSSPPCYIVGAAREGG